MVFFFFFLIVPRKEKKKGESGRKNLWGNIFVRRVRKDCAWIVRDEKEDENREGGKGEAEEKRGYYDRY